MKSSIFIILLLVLPLILTGCEEIPTDCTEDSDCVSATCCHPDACVPKGQAPNCEEILCSLECAPNTMDCGGKCTCENNKCKAVFAVEIK